MSKTAAAGLGLAAAVLLAAGMLVVWLNTGEGIAVGNDFAIPFSIGAGATLALALGGLREGRRREAMTWAAAALLVALLWAAVIVAMA